MHRWLSTAIAILMVVSLVLVACTTPAAQAPSSKEEQKPAAKVEQPKAAKEQAKPTKEQNAPQEEDMNAIYEAAKKEGQVNVYASMNEKEANPLIEQFEKTYPGVKGNYLRASETQLLSRILTEARANKSNFDVFASTTAESAKTAGLTQAWIPPNSKAIPNEFKDEEGHYYAVYLNYNVLQYNTKKVPKDQAPKKYEDLLDPKWKNQMVIDESDFEWFKMEMDVMGKDKAIDLFKKIAANGATTRDGHALIADLVAAGEYTIAVNNYLNLIEGAKRQGGATDWIAIEPVPVFFGAVVISKTPSHPNAAKLYENFLLSKQAQEFMRKAGRVPSRSDVDTDPPGMLKGIKVISMKGNLKGATLDEVTKLYRSVWKGL